MIKVAGLNKNDVVNGEGVSVSLFLQGCPFHCKGCHNPETWSFDGGDAWDEDELIQLIIEAIGANGIVRNLSILGGEPFNSEEKIIFINKLIEKVKQQYPTIKIIAWSGYLYEELLADKNMQYILNNLDYLIDGPFKIEERDITLKWRGSHNQRIIKLK